MSNFRLKNVAIFDQQHYFNNCGAIIYDIKNQNAKNLILCKSIFMTNKRGNGIYAANVYKSSKVV